MYKVELSFDTDILNQASVEKNVCRNRCDF